MKTIWHAQKLQKKTIIEPWVEIWSIAVNKVKNDVSKSTNISDKQVYRQCIHMNYV